MKQRTKRRISRTVVRQFRCYPKGPPRQIDVDSTSILRRCVEDQISTNFIVISTYFFDVISLIEKSTSFPRTFFDGRNVHVFFFDGRNVHVFSMYFIRCNFDVRKIHVVFTCFLQCNFSGLKIHVVSTCFFRRNFDGRKIHVVCTYFFLRNFDWQKFDVGFG